MTAITIRSPRLSVLTRIRRVWTQYRIKCAYDDLARYAGTSYADPRFIATTLAFIADLEASL